MSTVIIDKQKRKELLERFVRYAKIYTTSDRHQDVIPSTERQWDLIRLLETELKELGISDVDVSKNGYIIARLPASSGVNAPVIGFMAHVDTSEDAPGENVNPIIWDNYNGGVLEIGSGLTLDPAQFPVLSSCKGQTLISTDGSTLLGADDKAGIAEIMTAVDYLIQNPEIKHGGIEIIFTPDEETGKGPDLFPVEKLNSLCAYTMDGDENGVIESECFSAFQIDIKFKGIMIHPGSARGKLVNAVTMASFFMNMLPQVESPEATDGRYGFYYPMEIHGKASDAELTVFIRDFNTSVVETRIKTVEKIAEAVEAVFPGGSVIVESKRQYLNMLDYINKDSRILGLLRDAVTNNGIHLQERLIRGGTDGARLSELGIPTPNIFTGGQNYHSKQEWASLDVMENAVKTIVELIRLWGKESL